MSNNKVRFSFNWNNKLENKAFTTIRIHNESKYIAGNDYDIELNNKPKGVALLKEKRTINISQLNDFICYLDTGYNRDETIAMLQRMYKHIDLKRTFLYLCLFVYIKPNNKEIKEIQQTLIFDR